ncbi:hypothetical protein ELE36_00855 [Pseudolysobacter antarcticus]|uniref:Uncharacterized protein n=1 Tax=Pseudolysobacter antarcticus TaxID=2511995 RepID=A0A411HEX7_9GAMM|nr:hypothetical protein [Pseudolysobacter antarcticus]QBB69045.1 hypothetical protein ELE36_00855 [Pseudolysobacter antarcticus]
MKFLLPFLLVLIAPLAGATERGAPQRVLTPGPPLVAQLVNGKSLQSVRDVQVPVFDSYTGTQNFREIISNSNMTYVGMPIDLGSAGGANPIISSISVYCAFLPNNPTNYAGIRARVQLLDNWSSAATGNTPVFSSAVGYLIEAQTGPLTFQPNTFMPFNLPLDPPIPLSGLTSHGIVVNFQSDRGTGLGFRDDDALTAIVRDGGTALAVGSNPLDHKYGYFHDSSRTNFNFLSTELFGFGPATQNQAVVFQLFSVASLVQASLVQDGSFEAGVVPDYWTQTSTGYGTPVCGGAACPGARTGAYWVWFGGANGNAEAGSVEQTGNIASGPKTLNFYVWWESSISSPPDPAATFKVKMDGTTIFSLTPATAGPYSTAYTLATVDISAYANDAAHTLRFEASNAASAGDTSVYLDDISIVRPDKIFANSFD